MARHMAIAAVSTALLGLMQDRYPRDEFGSALDFRIFQGKDFEGGMTEGFSLYLYRVAVSTAVRNLTCRRDADSNRYRPSLPVDLFYLLSPWAADGEKQQRMLGWAMRFLEDLGIVGAGRLNHYVREIDTFAADESIDIVCDPLALGDYVNVWDKLKPRMPTSMTYVARMINLDSDVRIERGLVQTRAFDIGVPSA